MERPVRFDGSHQMQFVLFLQAQEGADADGLMEALGELVSAPVAGVENMGLKLGSPALENVFSQQPAGLTPGQQVVWNAGSGIWRLILNPSRLDLHFDARGYAEIREVEAPSVELTVNRVAPNLAGVGDLLASRINRIAFVVSGQSTEEAAGGSPTVIAARQMFGGEVLEKAATGEIRDLLGRVNSAEDWSFPGVDESVRVNRIEAAQATWNYSASGAETSLVWKADVNTGPELTAEVDFGGADILDFYSRAVVWISERLNSLSAE